MAVSEALRTALHAVATPEGFVRFDRFLEVALYDPAIGYYARPATRTGRSGDFYTAPQTGPLLARTLARRIEAEHRRLGRPRRFTVVELGPGEAPLAAGLLEPGGLDLGEGVEVSIALVERTAARQDAALSAVRRAAGSARVDARALARVASLGPFCGVIVGNELLDALPFRRLVRRGERWNEAGVEIDGDDLAWIESVDRQHPGGTVTAYRAHEAVDPLAEPGSADLSAFVNFSRVRAAAEASGLRVVAYERQAEALGRWGLPGELAAAVATAESAESEVKARLGAKSLAFGFETFRALELGVG